MQGSTSNRRFDLAAISEPNDYPHRSTAAFFVACFFFLILVESLGWATVKNVRKYPDFRSFYSAGYMMRTEPSHLYDLVRQKEIQDTLVAPAQYPLPFNHPSYESLIYAPFSFLPYGPAYLAFIAFDVLLLIAIFFIARPLFSPAVPFLQPRPGLIFFLFVPLMIAIWQGQDSIIFLLLLCLTWRQLQNKKDLNAGLILALGLFRFQLAIPIAILVAVRRGWRFSLGFLAGGVAVVSLCAAIVGRAGIAQLYSLLSAGSMSADQRAATQQVLGIFPSAMGNLRGFLYATVTRHFSPGPAFAIAIVASLALFLWCVFLVRREKQDAIAFAIAILCAILVSYHLNVHDLTMLLLPLVLLAQQANRFVLLLCYCLPAVLLLSVGPNSFFLLAIPTIWLLFYESGTGKPAVVTLSNTLSATPLYTQK